MFVVWCVNTVFSDGMGYSVLVFSSSPNAPWTHNGYPWELDKLRQVCLFSSMTDNLHNLLAGDEPVALRRIEKALHSADVENETVEAVVSALIWRRCTAGPNGVLGAVLNHECAARIDVLPEHLDTIGASDAAQAVRDLRADIPLEDEQRSSMA